MRREGLKLAVFSYRKSNPSLLIPSLQPLRSLRVRLVLPRMDVGEERDFERDDGFHRFF